MNEHLNSFYQKAREHNDIANDLFRKYDIKKGLRNEDGTGVRVGLTKIADVVGYKYVEEVKTDDIGKLYYRGIELRDIIHGRNYETICGYEEACFLLLFGYLPKKEELQEFCGYLRAHYELPDDFLESKFLHMPGKNLMNRLQQAVLALYDYDDAPDNISVENTLEQGLNILAKLPSIICYAYQSKMHRYNKESLVIHPAQEQLSIAENILYMLRKDHAFSDLEAKLLDMMLIVHADHGGGNNSTFTNVVISSTGTDFYSSMVGAIGSMKGPRHGGANLKVSGMMKAVIEEIGYCENDIEIKALIEFYQRFEQCAKEVILDVKGVHVSSNVDFYSGFVYGMMGIPEDLFTPLFVMARTIGWLAHNIENKEYDGRIMRPATKYVGSVKQYVKMEDR